MENDLRLEVIDLNVDKNESIFQTEDCQTLLGVYPDYYAEIGYNLPWVGYFVFQNDKVVGSCGFTGKPNNGVVEIAYWTFKEFEGNGIASFSCSELIKISKNADINIKVTAKTAPENNASTSILKKNGFIYQEIVQDHEIGDAWLWVLNK